MTLIDLKQDETYRITNINCKEETLLRRLLSMGIYEGAEVMLGHTSTWGHTCSIYTNGAQVALRKSEAKLIEVEYTKTISSR